MRGNSVYAPDSSMKKDMDLVLAHRRMLRKHNFDECNNKDSINEREDSSDKSPD